ncbi:MAG: hypothetical protein AABW85_03130 [archaeon]
MNKKGFFSLILLLFFIILSLKTAKLEQAFSNQTKETQKTLLDIEKSSYLRAELETNFDFTARQSMLIGALTSADSELLKEFTAKQIAIFAEKETELRQGELEFSFFNKTTMEKTHFSDEKMKQLVAIHSKLRENFFDHEFSYTGGQEKGTLFGAEIKTGNYTQHFFITPGYSVKEISILEN